MVRNVIQCFRPLKCLGPSFDHNITSILMFFFHTSFPQEHSCFFRIWSIKAINSLTCLSLSYMSASWHITFLLLIIMHSSSLTPQLTSVGINCTQFLTSDESSYLSSDESSYLSSDESSYLTSDESSYLTSDESSYPGNNQEFRSTIYHIYYWSAFSSL